MWVKFAPVSHFTPGNFLALLTSFTLKVVKKNFFLKLKKKVHTFFYFIHIGKIIKSIDSISFIHLDHPLSNTSTIKHQRMHDY